jgi:ferric-dicitrate binding protein FerR (iron transport regulator)
MDGAEERIQSLLDTVIDGTASDTQRGEFAELVEQHPELTSPLIEQLRTHSLLQWQCHEIKDKNLQLSEPLHDALVVANPSRRRSRRIVLRWIASIAAVLVLAGTTVFWPNDAVMPSGQLTVAEVVEDNGVVWSANTTALTQGRLIHPGILEIEAGTLTLRFRSGATVLFRGAASMRIESDMLVRLDRGQATAQVPHWATGFTIETDDVEIIDLGTQFGVMARGDGATDVVIFEGEVDVKPTGGRPNVQKRLIQGEAARINSDGAINRIVEVHGDTKAGWSTAKNSGQPRSVFAAIRDNIPPSDGSKYFYYQITPGGLDDDARAYVGRHPHQWNGLTAAGLPEFLRGADYARTFNDYRYILDFEIVVDLAGPADLYVFFDDRVETPDWLKKNFEDTGVNIGLDEGPWLLHADELKQVDLQKVRELDVHTTATGGGSSIDNIFSVWRRRCVDGGTISLGHSGDWGNDRIGFAGKGGRSMYGIAATPLELKPAARVSN